MKIERFHETISQLLGTLPQISSHAVKSSTMSRCLVVQVFKESSTQGFNQCLLKQYSVRSRLAESQIFYGSKFILSLIRSEFHQQANHHFSTWMQQMFIVHISVDSRCVFEKFTRLKRRSRFRIVISRQPKNVRSPWCRWCLLLTCSQRHHGADLEDFMKLLWFWGIKIQGSNPWPPWPQDISEDFNIFWAFCDLAAATQGWLVTVQNSWLKSIKRVNECKWLN